MQFQLNHAASSIGCGLMGYFNASCHDLIRAFGEPTHPSERVTTIWKFQVLEADDIKFVRETVTLYEYKETAEYGDSELTVEEFRNLPSHDWHVGALTREVAQAFQVWLQRELELLPKDESKEAEWAIDAVLGALGAADSAIRDARKLTQDPKLAQRLEGKRPELRRCFDAAQTNLVRVGTLITSS